MLYRQEFQPHDVALLCSVFDDYCSDNRIADNAAREQVASKLVFLFQTGNTTREALEAGLVQRQAA